MAIIHHAQALQHWSDVNFRKLNKCHGYDWPTKTSTATKLWGSAEFCTDEHITLLNGDHFGSFERRKFGKHFPTKPEISTMSWQNVKVPWAREKKPQNHPTYVDQSSGKTCRVCRASSETENWNSITKKPVRNQSSISAPNAAAAVASPLSFFPFFSYSRPRDQGKRHLVWHDRWRSVARLVSVSVSPPFWGFPGSDPRCVVPNARFTH